VIDWVDDYLFDETLVFLGEDGAQLADPRLGDLVRGGGEVWVNNHAHALRPLRADPHFLALHLSTFDRSAFVSGATREKITQADMGSIPVPALDVDGQWREGSLLLRSRQASRTVSARLGNQIDLLTELRQALITAAVTGELDVAGATAEEAS
jgi:type I restriction enzyme S subunit